MNVSNGVLDKNGNPLSDTEQEAAVDPCSKEAIFEQTKGSA